MSNKLEEASIYDIKSTSKASGTIATHSFAKHLNEEAHSFGTIHNIMQVLQYYKRAHMNTIERFHIHAEFKPTIT